MADGIDAILAGAKAASAHAENKFPTAAAPVSKPAAPSYTAVREARKSPTMADEMKAKGDMVQKAKTALNQ